VKLSCSGPGGSIFGSCSPLGKLTGAKAIDHVFITFVSYVVVESIGEMGLVRAVPYYVRNTAGDLDE
jgi:hypothetical protein